MTERVRNASGSNRIPISGDSSTGSATNPPSNLATTNPLIEEGISSVVKTIEIDVVKESPDTPNRTSPIDFKTVDELFCLTGAYHENAESMKQMNSFKTFYTLTFKEPVDILETYREVDEFNPLERAPGWGFRIRKLNDLRAMKNVNFITLIGVPSSVKQSEIEKWMEWLGYKVDRVEVIAREGERLPEDADEEEKAAFLRTNKVSNSDLKVHLTNVKGREFPTHLPLGDLMIKIRTPYWRLVCNYCLSTGHRTDRCRSLKKVGFPEREKELRLASKIVKTVEPTPAVIPSEKAKKMDIKKVRMLTGDDLKAVTDMIEARKRKRVASTEVVEEMLRDPMIGVDPQAVSDEPMDQSGPPPRSPLDEDPELEERIVLNVQAYDGNGKLKKDYRPAKKLIASRHVMNLRRKKGEEEKE